MTTEYRTNPVSRDAMLVELSYVCDQLTALGVSKLAISFGWDSNLPIESMWQEHVLAPNQAARHIEDAEAAGTIVLGKSDVFVQAELIRLTLCHEGDLHLHGTGALVGKVRQRWEERGYKPYATQPASNPSFKRTPDGAA